MLFSAGTALQLEKHIQGHLGFPQNTDNTTYFPIRTEKEERQQSREQALPERRLCGHGAGQLGPVLLAEHIYLLCLLGIARRATSPQGTWDCPRPSLSDQETRRHARKKMKMDKALVEPVNLSRQLGLDLPDAAPTGNGPHLQTAMNPGRVPPVTVKTAGDKVYCTCPPSTCGA